MLVNEQNLKQTLDRLALASLLAVDTETTGISPYQGDKPFSVIVYDGKHPSYFPLYTPIGSTDDAHLWHGAIDGLRCLFGTPNLTTIFHNAKFDLAMLARVGIEVAGTVSDTEVRARLLSNDLLSYSLDSCAKRIGLKKDDRVKEYVLEHGLFTGKGDEKKLHYEQVPIEIMRPYAEMDVEVTYKLWEWQEAKLRERQLLRPVGKRGIDDVRKTEEKVTKVCFQMERAGIRVDRAYCASALEHEKDQYQRAAKDFESLTGCVLVDSPKGLSRAFDRVEAGYGRTEKGNPSFTEEVLQSIPSRPGDLVLKYRHHYKRAHTYFENFLKYSDDLGRLHAVARQAGTATGRFSYAEPNLQNCSKEEEDAANTYVIRKAFVPSPGYSFFMLDYDQQEYRMMLDYAGEKSVIDKVLSGTDVHQATAEMMGVDRTTAKCIAKGSLILTARGYVPIELILPSDKIFDGVEFVNHGGIVHSGVKEVIFYSGITATVDHLVLCEDNLWRRLCDAKKHGIAIKRGDLDWCKIRDTHSYLKFHLRQKRWSFVCFMQSLQERIQNWVQQCEVEKDYKLPLSEEQNFWRSYGSAHNKPNGKIPSSKDKVQFPQCTRVGTLRWKRDYDEVQKLKGMGRVFHKEVHSGRNNEAGGGSNRQQWTLRAKKYADDPSITEFIESKDYTLDNLQKKEGTCGTFTFLINYGLSLIQVVKRSYKKIGSYGGTLARNTKKNPPWEVYDIQNCGPRNRFVCQGRIVHNCVNFLLLYGGGSQKLAHALKIPEPRAKELRSLYFSRLPRVARFIREVIRVAEVRGLIRNWAGREYVFANPQFAYKAPNYLIQGGSADVIKLAMVGCDEVLRGTRSRLLLNIHDELLFEIHDDEHSLVPKLKEVMEKAYPHTLLPLTCGVEWSKKSWAEKEEWTSV